MPKNRLIQILIELHPQLGEIAYDDLYNNFVELLEEEAGEYWEYYSEVMEER